MEKRHPRGRGNSMVNIPYSPSHYISRLPLYSIIYHPYPTPTLTIANPKNTSKHGLNNNREPILLTEKYH
jgi:hypothetical protein